VGRLPPTSSSTGRPVPERRRARNTSARS
jgi:hypothetical protein